MFTEGATDLNFLFEERLSDSPFVEKIWHTRSEAAGSFTSLAAVNSEIVFTTIAGRTSVALRGPETKATPADCPPDADFFGIVFRLGAFMPHFPVTDRMDRRDVSFPVDAGKSFWLAGSAWELPTFENADTFLARLARQDLLAHDDVVGAVLQNQLPDLSVRTVRRRFLRATGLTPGAIHQIERARFALSLLEQGTSILDTAFEAGYYDQPHLTRALKHFLGKTPAQIAALEQPQYVSVSYNTIRDLDAIMSHVQPVYTGELT